MYNAQTIKDRIKTICKEKKISMETMLEDCELGVNAIRQINDNKGIASFSLAKIADYLGCSIDYLLGRTDNSVNVQTVSNNNGIIGHNHAPVTIINGSERKLTEQEIALLEIFGKLDVIKQAQLLANAAELAK